MKNRTTQQAVGLLTDGLNVESEGQTVQWLVIAHNSILQHTMSCKHPETALMSGTAYNHSLTLQEVTFLHECQWHTGYALIHTERTPKPK
jgi:hypothetical protein